MPSFDWLLHDPSSPLLFSSMRFLLLWTLLVAGWAALGSRSIARLAWLLLFSGYYYYRCNGLLVLVLAGVTVADWAVAIALARTSTPRARQGWLVAGIALNLGLLGYFKYTGLLLATMAQLTGASPDPVAIFLPIGISFHVFQSVSYLVEVYRRSIEPTSSLFEYALFLSFFPQLVAGPIVRPTEFFPQIRRPLTVDSQSIGEGLCRVLVGLAKKALCADYLAGYVDLVFGAPRAYGGFEIVLAAYAYAAQIYLDFSGYTDMALGFARILGIALPENFDAPYRATSITDFWRRWHMSLSRWLRDYLYIPLGGNRRGPVRRVVNLMLTMLLGGLWHGAAWTFVVWGGLHGVALALDRWARDALPRAPTRLRKALGWLWTFHLVTALWLLFRAPSFDAALELGAGVGRGWELARTAMVLQVRHAEIAAVALGLGAGLAPTAWWRSLGTRFARTPWPAQALLFAGMLLAADLIPKNGIVPFIYFQF